MKRRLSREEAQLWARVAQSVEPLDRTTVTAPPAPVLPLKRKAMVPFAKPAPAPSPGNGAGPKPASLRPLDTHGLDATWDRRLARGLIGPDFTLDLHGHSLDAAHARLDRGLAQAKALGARLVLVITGRSRPVEAADRASRRGAIRAKVQDWLALGEHALDIAAVRGAHRRHGGAGALYVVLRRQRS